MSVFSRKILFILSLPHALEGRRPWGKVDQAVCSEHSEPDLSEKRPL